MQKKYQIFVSSTFRDLAEERQDAIRSILDLGHIPAGMELFPASDTEQLTYIKKVIDECDYYILIIGGRYGSLDADGVGYTEREYDYAVRSGKVILAFVHGDASQIPVGKSDTAPRLVEALNEFREKVMTGRLVQQWTSRESLEAKVTKAIARATNEHPAVGWVRGNAVASEDLLLQLNDIRAENLRLVNQVKDLKAKTEPLIGNLAGLNELITIPYTYSISVYRGGSIEAPDSIKVSWGTIYRLIAPHLLSPVQRSTLSYQLAKGMKDDLSAKGFPTLKESTVATIENQFVALGYIQSYNTSTVKGGVAAFL